VTVRVHGTCVAVEGRGALFRGAPGSGKSDLALRLIERGAQLVSDDQVILDEMNGAVRACAEPRLQGKLEVRGIGILDVPSVGAAPLLAIFDLATPEEIPRLPEAQWEEPIPGIKVRVFRLAPFEASAPDKVRLTLSALDQL
jgi:serine kinase of HPr protein (carbohydrate metabolism regulator)